MRSGFVTDRIVGSHHAMVFPGDGTVPVHSNHDLKPIIKQAGFSLEEFKALL
jgi:predicted RNA binding protein YcfA (HicA-like mRNA interferase family)